MRGRSQLLRGYSTEVATSCHNAANNRPQELLTIIEVLKQLSALNVCEGMLGCVCVEWEGGQLQIELLGTD